MKLSYKRTFLVGLAFLSISAFWQAYEGIIPLILKNTFHLSDSLSGFVMALDNILALFMLPLFGSLSDRTNTKLGRRTPYILGGTIGASVFAVFIPIAAAISSMPLFFVALGLVLLAMSTYRSPAVALMPDVTPKPLRSKANAVINLMGAVGGILSLGLVAVLVPKNENPSYVPVFACVVAIMLISVVALLLTVRENKLVQKMHEESGEAAQDQKKAEPARRLSPGERRSLVFILCSVFLWFFGYNAVTTAFSKYAQNYWGLEGGIFAYTLIVAQVAAIIAFIPAGIAASRVGRRKTILFGIALLTLSFACAFFFRTFSVAIFGFFAVAGIAWAAINVNSYPMVVELSRGSDIGRYTGFYYTFSMSAQIVTPILSGFLFDLMKAAGYYPFGEAFAGSEYWLLFPYGAIFVALSFVTMLFVRHGDSCEPRGGSPQRIKTILRDSLDSLPND